MEMTAAAAWLNSFFAGYDKAILSALHAVSCGFLTFIFKLITLLGEKGLIFILLSLILMCFSRTRRLGICLFGAVGCGALITNFILKDMIARPRPFETVDLYRQWWQAIGSPAEDDFSFPSGHVTAAAAAMTALRLQNGKKWTIPGIVVVVLMMISRNYMMAHYPSDVLAGLLIGLLSGFVAKRITDVIYRYLNKNSGKAWCSMVLRYNIPDFAGVPSRLGLITDEEEVIAIYGKDSTAVLRKTEALKKEYAKKKEQNSKLKALTETGTRLKASGSGESKDRNRGASRQSAGYVGKHEKR